MKILFITTMDFGELSLATFFARNQPFQSIFAIPESRANYFDEIVDMIYIYSSISELKRVIEKETPDVISLNTGYLVINGSLATVDEFKDFFKYIKEYGCPILTTDPFVRVYDKFPECSFQLHGNELLALKEEIQFLNGYLKDLPHIYGFPCSNNPQITHSFYNPNYCKDISNKTSQNDQWLFVLGEIDFNLLVAKHGKSFITILTNRLKDICRNANNTVRCVFPNVLTDLLKEPLSKYKNLHLFDFLTLSHYEDLIKESDVVFYWNVFSNSILMCYYYNVPFICFEKGHVAELSPKLFDHMSAGIYPNGEPEFIDFFSPLESHLDLMLKTHFSLENRTRILIEYHRLPSPEQIIKTLLP